MAGWCAGTGCVGADVRRVTYTSEDLKMVWKAASQQCTSGASAQ